jgi:undecaprenyl-diphosphatase
VRRPAARLVLGFLAFVLVGWGLGELWLAVVGTLDLDAVRELAAQRSAAITSAARIVTWGGSGLVLVPLALVCCAWLLRAGQRSDALAIALSLGGAMLLWELVKSLVSRPRPPVEHLQAVTSSSFPSGHATQSSAFWLSLVLAVRASGAGRAARALVTAVAVAVVLVVGASRVYLGVHYPADVVAGWLLGGGWAAFVWRCTHA